MNSTKIQEILRLHKLWIVADILGVRANLRRADLQGANLREADLQGADLREADLRRASLQGADLREAYLQGANLREADLPAFKIVPEEGSFIGYKKVLNIHDQQGFILQLEILKTSKRVSSLIGRKCRADKVKVLKVYNLEGKDITKKIIKEKIILQSTYDNTFQYTVGKIIKVKDFDDDIRVECTKGIHFFMTKQEAINY